MGGMGKRTRLPVDGVRCCAPKTTGKPVCPCHPAQARRLHYENLGGVSMLFKTIHIKRYERGLWFRHGDFVDVLAPGTYRIPFWNFTRDANTVVDATRTRFEHAQLDVLLTNG